MRYGVHALVLGLVLGAAGHGFAITVPGSSFDSSAGSPTWTLPNSSASLSNVSSPLTYSADGWTVNGGDQALKFSGNDYSAASRSIAPPQSGDVWVRFLVQWHPGTIGTNEFLTCWFDNTNSSQADHTLVPNIGVKTNEGGAGGTDDMVVRLTINGGDYAGDINANPGATHMIVGHLYKSTPGTTTVYNRFEMWVDPTEDNPVGDRQASNYALDKGNTNLSSFSYIGFRSANLPSNGPVYMDDLLIAGTMGEVMQGGKGGDAPMIPEPLTMLALLAGVTGLSRYVRSRD